MTSSSRPRLAPALVLAALALVAVAALVAAPPAAAEDAAPPILTVEELETLMTPPVREASCTASAICPGDPALGIAPYPIQCSGDFRCEVCYFNSTGAVCGVRCNFGLSCFPDGCGPAGTFYCV